MALSSITEFFCCIISYLVYLDRVCCLIFSFGSIEFRSRGRQTDICSVKSRYYRLQMGQLPKLFGQLSVNERAMSESTKKVFRILYINE